MTDVLVRDTSSGRIHKRVRLDDQPELLSYEGCNADSSGAFEVVEASSIADSDEAMFCRRCFPAPAAADPEGI